MLRHIFVIGLAAAFAGCQSPLRPSEITYEVTGSAERATIAYNTPYGSSQATNVALPWVFAFSAEHQAFLSLSAQVVRGDGTVTVTIRRDSSYWKGATASGTASVATASGSLK